MNKSIPLMRLTFVTQNVHKVSDAQKLLPHHEIEHVDFVVPEIQSLRPEEIVEEKLRFAYERVGRPCFVMDASLFLDCLNGFPGPFIKWYFEETVGGEKTCEIAKLFQQFGCEWVTVLGYFDGKNATFFKESVRGSLPSSPRGTNGFHWDTIFIPEGETRTFAEMTFEEKQSFAVTKKLLARFDDFLHA
jgi:XTP/dITP diphosphohydrolase